MLSEERVDEIAKPFAGWGGVEQYREFASAIEREATAPLIEQIGRLQGEIGLALAKIKDDGAMLRTALHALRDLLEDTQHRDHKDCDDGPCPVREARASMEAIRQRLESKK